MRFTGLVRSEIKAVFRSGGAIMWFFVVPLLFALFFGLATGDQGKPVATALKVVDNDRGFLARELTSSLAREGFEIELLSPGQWKEGKWKPRGFEIPAGFTRDVLAGRKVTLCLVRDSSADAQRSAAAETRLKQAVFRMLGNLCLMAFEGRDQLPGAQAAYEKVAARQPLVTVEESFAGKIKVFPTGFNHTIPAMVVQFVLMCLAIYGTSLFVKERQSGILRRLSAGPISPAEILLVKLVSRIGMGLLQVVVLFSVGLLVFRIQLVRSVGALALLMIAYSAAAAAISLLLAGLLKTPGQASGVSVLVTMIMCALGGCWWPLEVVSPTMRAVALAFPTGWAMDAFNQLYCFGAGVSDIALHLAVLAGMGVVVLAIASRLLVRGLRA